ncbi:MAG: KpsF/GutQ family sugar-phosphate isomerase [Fuerstiella sp.]|nr:KpsF/GutQ family sugar-phosphate isomerase [Fuerstiella sp.]
MASDTGFREESMREQPTSSEVIPLDAVDQLRFARDVICEEAQALEVLADSLDTSFYEAVRLVGGTSGCVIVTGVGKAGLIGQKMVATFASTGTRAWFLHPTEALHGDIGCVHDDDIVLMISNSGRSEEVLRLLPLFSDRDIPVIALTRDCCNPLARGARVTINIGHHQEAGEFRLAPTTSTAAMLAAGDALALTISRVQGFTVHDFAKVHPAGDIGRQLLSVRDVMRTGEDLRMASPSRTIRSVLVDQQLPGRRTGAVLLVSDEGTLSGIFTDSDLTRLLEQHRENQLDRPIAEVMSANPCTIHQSALVPQAVEVMSVGKLSELPVIDDQGCPVGVIDITDLIDLRSSGEQIIDSSQRYSA